MSFPYCFHDKFLLFFNVFHENYIDIIIVVTINDTTFCDSYKQSHAHPGFGASPTIVFAPWEPWFCQEEVMSQEVRDRKASDRWHLNIASFDSILQIVDFK